MISGYRTRSSVAIGTLLVAGAGMAAGLWLGRDTEDERVASLREHLKPAAEALHATTRPTGFQECTNVRDADLCWEGQGSEVAAVPLLVSALQSAGATDLIPRCVRKPPSNRALCRVDGSLKGAVLDSLISMNGSHLQVVVYAASQPPPDILRGGIPIPLSP